MDERSRVAGRDFEHECDNGELAFIVDALVDHVDLQGEVFIIDVVLGGGVHVELDETVVGTGEAGRAVDNDFNCRSEVLEDYFSRGDVKSGPRGGRGDGGIWWEVLVGSDFCHRVSRTNIPTLMGDWFFPALHASFSGAREAQLKGPFIGP